MAPPLLLLVLFLLPALAAGHQHPSSYGSSALSEWRNAKSSYFAADPGDAIGGACGFGDLGKHGYGMATVGLSTALFERGAACGGCYEVKCVEALKYCLPGTSIVVTATNFCPPNYGFPADAGGVCNPPNHHFLLPIQAFEKIALWKAGVMPIQYRRIRVLFIGVSIRLPWLLRFILFFGALLELKHAIISMMIMQLVITSCIILTRAQQFHVSNHQMTISLSVKCLREGGVRFSVSGKSFFFTVLISNVGGAGDVRSVKIKGTESGWLDMGHNCRYGTST
uniref:Expansin n=1 Tax=Aegilops tauschii TaxID=37682 RepID=R7VZF9_AEGTA